jgi:hypothetical protein
MHFLIFRRDLVNPLRIKHTIGKLAFLLQLPLYFLFVSHSFFSITARPNETSKGKKHIIWLLALPMQLPHHCVLSSSAFHLPQGLESIPRIKCITFFSHAPLYLPNQYVFTLGGKTHHYLLWLVVASLS